MNVKKITQVREGMETAYIDRLTSSSLAYKPQFISNNYKEGRKVLSSIEEELLACEEFSISVAFITMSGITPLLQTFKELEHRGIRGRILTTNYLNFSEPKALEKLAGLRNITLKMFSVSGDDFGFHTKGYIFKSDEIYRIIIGSSNLTMSAITRNHEWNTRIVSTQQGEMTADIIREFDELWKSEKAIELDDFIETYRTRYEVIKRQRKAAREQEVVELDAYRLTPNSMQVEFISNLRTLRQAGEKKALLISATGTGKTYASAFALRDMNPQRALFIVHREQIARQAKESYQKVFGKSKTVGILSGNSRRQSDKDIIFATIQTISKPEVYENFDKATFDVIVLDEVHRAGAVSYDRVMRYFTPKFWLGMTASPDRMDGFDIYKLFDHNIACEITLKQALENNLLCPFHYFGITDLEIDGEIFDDSIGLRNFSYLVSDARVDYVIKQAKYYGYSGNRVKGLIFVSRKEEARELSIKFNKRGYQTVALGGDDSQEYRSQCVNRLSYDDIVAHPDYLDYIFTVDIFNEGVDIPQINQVIMLRPTQSPIVFVQQLGRGLRRAANKEYVVILDFIGNYKNNFMIPIALSGDRTYNKDTIRRYMREGSRVIPGCSTIHFDEIARKRIFSSIDQSTTTKKMLSEKYQSLKNRLGRIPTILEFYEYGEIDPLLFIEYSKASYHKFLQLVDKDYKITFTKNIETFLEFVSQMLVNGKRPHELLILRLLMEEKSVSREIFRQKLESIGTDFHEEDYNSACRVLSLEWSNTQAERKKYEQVKFFDQSNLNTGLLKRAVAYDSLLNEGQFHKQLMELIEYGLLRYNDFYREHDDDNLVLYEKYSRKDVCRILNWDKDDSSTVYGYRCKYNTCPIFVTYEKKENITASTRYEDQFVDQQLFSWMTRSRVTIDSAESRQIINFKENGLKIFLFIKKSDGEGTDFYYMGKAEPIAWSETTIVNDNGDALPIMNFKLKLEYSVRNDIYEYLTK